MFLPTSKISESFHGSEWCACIRFDKWNFSAVELTLFHSNITISLHFILFKLFFIFLSFIKNKTVSHWVWVTSLRVIAFSISFHLPTNFIFFNG